MADLAARIAEELEPGETLVCLLLSVRTTTRRSGNVRTTTTRKTPAALTDRRILEFHDAKPQQKLEAWTRSTALTSLNTLRVASDGLLTWDFGRTLSRYEWPGGSTSPEQKAALERLVRRFEAGEVGLPLDERRIRVQERAARAKAASRRRLGYVGGGLAVLGGLGAAGSGLMSLLGTAGFLLDEVMAGFAAGFGSAISIVLSGFLFGLFLLVVGATFAVGGAALIWRIRGSGPDVAAPAPVREAVSSTPRAQAAS